MAPAAPVPVPKAPGEEVSPAAPSPAVPPTHCWALPTPLHLARLEGEFTEEHILRGLD
ncbi:hypothetical protein ACIBVL_40795 [Streptomyces sp. NPDC049687]|uniref:hypothetical protein n=1 Tax=Streptomyces sp. NPDC049687 TaxID=3365596 RepID=UPI00378D1450